MVTYHVCTPYGGCRQPQGSCADFDCSNLQKGGQIKKKKKSSKLCYDLICWDGFEHEPLKDTPYASFIHTRIQLFELRTKAMRLSTQ